MSNTESKRNVFVFINVSKEMKNKSNLTQVSIQTQSSVDSGSAETHLQFGGGSRVMSASSF